MFTARRHDNLDPRRAARDGRTRDFRSMSRTVAIPNLPQLLARALVKLGLVR